MSDELNLDEPPSSNGTNGHLDFVFSRGEGTSNRITGEARLSEIIADIAGGKYRKPVTRIRTDFFAAESAGRKGKDAVSKLKLSLPAVTFSGRFKTRNNESLLAHSGLLCVDLDNLKDQVEGVRDQVVVDPHTLAAFVSPTGTGLKVVVRCDPERPHIESFHAAEIYFLQHFGLEIDHACKDVSRLCFLSDDPDAFLASHAEVIPYPPAPIEVAPPVTQSAHLGITPGDDYDSKAEITALLSSAGWKKIGRHGWTRPGKDHGVSATFDKVPGRFYVFSSEAQPFEPNHVYRPWHVYALLEHHGDFAAAAKALYAKGYGARQISKSTNVDGPPPQAAGAIQSALPIPHTLRPLFSIPLVPPGHASILLGNRYLNRGDGAVIVSSSGMGKSAMCLQMATELALNIGPFGIQGNGPLRSLIVQSEDGDGDLAEVTHSIRHVMKLTDEQVRLAEERVIVATDGSNRGPRFLQALKASIATTKPDLVWLNPLQAFMAGDVTKGEDISEFLREGLNGLNADRTFGYIIVHHTTKPATGKERAERLWHEVMYDMAGGAEIINWARAILSLRPTAKEGNFNLVLAKRGRRAGVTKEVPHGIGVRLEPVTTIPLKHASGHFPTPYGDLPTIFWESRPPDEPEGEEPKRAGAPAKYQFSEFRGAFPAKKESPKRINEIYQTVMQNCPGLSNKHFYNLISRWREDGFIEQVTEMGIHRYRMSL